TVVTDREQRIAELERALREHEEMRVELDGRIAERDGRLIERNALLGDRERIIAVMRQQVSQYAAEIERLIASVTGLEDQLAASERERAIAALHEREQRSMLTSLQEIQFQRDAEIMGTLGAVLSRHAPGAPAAIYHRQLMQHIRGLAETHLPSAAPT